MKQDKQAIPALWWVLVVACSGFLGMIAWPAFVGKGYIYGDLGSFQLPFRTFIHDQMRNGVLPLWEPNSFNGLYLHGEGQVGMLHPVHLILFPLFDPQLLMQIELAAWPFLLLLGCYMLFRRWNVSPAAALLGGIVFAFAGFSREHLPHI